MRRLTKKQRIAAQRNLRRARASLIAARIDRKRRSERKRMQRQYGRRFARVFNEWMRRYIDDPERFEREFVSVLSYVRNAACDRDPPYGRACAEYFFQLLGEIG